MIEELALLVAITLSVANILIWAAIIGGWQ